MAKLQHIHPLITATTRDLLRQAAQERTGAQGKRVASALLAFVPGEARGS